MSDFEPKHISLYMTEGSSDKEYHAQLEQSDGGWLVNFQYGRRGRALKSGTKTKSALDYPSVANFLSDLHKTCIKHGVEIKISDNSRISYPTGDGMAVSGYFTDRPKPVIGVATGKEMSDWLAVLVHESSHMDQWLEKSKVWSDVIVNGKETTDYIDEWLTGKNDFPLPVEEMMRRSFAVEFDCERRTIEKYKQYGLPENTEELTQKALSYVYFYPYMLKSRKWYEDNRAPYELKSVWSKAPTSFEGLDENIPADLLKAFDEAYGEKLVSKPKI